MNEFIETFLLNTNATDDNTKWLFRGFPFDSTLNKEIQSVVSNMEYGDFLKTLYWKTISAIVKEDSGNKCSKCGSTENLEVHHKTYDNHGLEHLKSIQDSDLTCICHKCHSKEHNKPNNETFIFYSSWLELLHALEDKHSREYANELYRQICEYGITGEIQTEDPIFIAIINSMVKPLVDRSSKRYRVCKQNGKMGGAPPQYDHNKMIELYNQGMNINQISKRVNCSYNAVRNVINKYKASAEGDDEI